MPANRPQPYQMPEAEFYWSSGADGVLRIQHCDDCDSLVHPPKPVCHYCRSTNQSVAEVSGKGTVVGVTVNHQQWLPSFEPPYVVASVALAEDPRVFVTTNIVGCEPDDVYVGMPVEVEFEEDDGTWFPIFHPTGERRGRRAPRRSPSIPVETLRSARPMLTTEKFEDKVALTGIGLSRLGRRLMVDPLELTIEACRPRGRRRRSHLRRHRRALHLPGDVGAGRAFRGRHHRGGVGAAAAAHLVQRRAASSPARAACSSPRCSRWRRACAATSCASAPCGRPPPPSGCARASTRCHGMGGGAARSRRRWTSACPTARVRPR